VSGAERHAASRTAVGDAAAITTALDRMAQDRERHQERRTHAQSARRDAMATPRGPLRGRSRPDLLDQCSAYACPMRAHARLHRRTASTCRSQRNRSSPVTSRRARPAYACVRRIDKAPRNSPEKLGSSTPPRTRHRWSQRCAYAKAHDEADELVAGVQNQHPTIGFQTRRSRWSPDLPYAAACAVALLSRAATRRESRETGREPNSSSQPVGRMPMDTCQCAPP